MIWERRALTHISAGAASNAYKAVAAAKGIIADTIAPRDSIYPLPHPAPTVSGTYWLQAQLRTNVGVTKVELYVDGGLFATGTNPRLQLFMEQHHQSQRVAHPFGEGLRCRGECGFGFRHGERK
jgi:hypothetical protein